MVYFHGQEAASRYERYRPKVHAAVVGWLREHFPEQKMFSRALDIGCGTGHSMLPLLDIALHVEGIDLSEPMLDVVKSKGLNVRRCSYGDVSAGVYDLLSVCMAFHWFDQAEAIAAFKRASADRAVWLIYNFGLAGNSSDPALDQWLKGSYMQHFPAPQRGPTRFGLPAADAGLNVVAEGAGTLPLRFTRSELAGYLTTQSNVEAAVHAGRCYEEIEQWLLADMPPFVASDDFSYAYTYSIVQCCRSGMQSRPYGPCRS